MPPPTFQRKIPPLRPSSWLAVFLVIKPLRKWIWLR